MRAHLIVAAALALVSLAAPAQEVLPDKFIPHDLPNPGTMMCYPIFGYCVARIEDQLEARKVMREAPRAIYELQAQLKRLQEIKGRAKVEVEPSKKPELKIVPGTERGS